MSTDTDWLDEPLQNFRRIVWYSGWNSSSDEALQTLKNAILAHESQAVKAADKAGRANELKKIEIAIICTLDTPHAKSREDAYRYIDDRLKQLQRLEIDPFTDIAVDALEVLLNEAGQYLTPERFDRFLLAALQPYDRLEADGATG